MKNIIKLVLCSILFSSCVKQKESMNKNVSSTSEQLGKSNYSIYIEKIDGCEYLVLDGSYGRSIIHKENCKNNH